VISQVKLIAEPWDLGEGGYQVGRFPVGWTEWNGKYRDSIRDYWKGEGGLIGELAYRVAGSSDLYEQGGRRPYASVNFVTAHDGFTLRDLVSYNDKHNEANKDENSDGENHNRSWNCGAEGPTDDPEIRALRLRQSRNLFASLLLSQGVPMLLAGDEVGRTQQGNNNAYCQDNELAWQSWETGEEDGQLLEFVRRLIRLRQEHRVFRRQKFFQNRAIRGENVRDIVWLDPAGTQMSDDQWRDGFARSLGVFLSGRGLDERDERGRTVVDNDFLVLINAHHETVEFKLPAQPEDAKWVLRVDTTNVAFEADERTFAPGDSYALQGRALALFEFPQQREKP
jgi:glycogen operon protein